MSQLGSKKSRRGCKRCKQRRVKCDEEAPCSNCVRRNEECSLLEPTPSGSSEVADPGLPATADEWIQDLELMHHYTSSVSQGQLGARGRVVHLWRNYVPQQALKHNFLMHGLLALSALHLAYSNPDSAPRYLQLCDKHQAIALNKFRTILSSDVDPELADALFALASTISVSTMARCTAMSESDAMNMDEITELFFLTRGVRDVIHLTYEHIQKGPMVEMFGGHVYPPDAEVKLPQSVSKELDDIRQMLTQYGLDPEALTHCQSALTDLEEIYRNIVYWNAVSTLETGQVFRWQTMVTTEFVRLIQGRCPPALVILAYYAAGTTAVRTAWYTQNWGECTVRGVGLELDSSMQHWTVWPMQQIEERMAVLGSNPANAESDPAKPLIGF